MRVLLLQDAPHLPSWGGGNKANRRLLEGLAALGHPCALAARALNETIAPSTAEELRSALRERGIRPRGRARGAFRYAYRGVAVSALDHATVAARGRAVRRLIRNFAPDWLLVSDDRRHFLLEAALAERPERTVALVHTAFHLPFGPQATSKDPAAHARLRAARAILTVSRFAAGYLREHGGLDAQIVHFPVFDPPPDSPTRGETVAMINPCGVKGLAIFLALARRFPHVPFAAVPTWGADAEVLRQLGELPNVAIWAPADSLGELLARVRVLLVPSLIPETFGYVAVEAMAAGIPVLASDLGGLPEAKLGVPHLLPVTPAEPWLDLEPWAATLARLLERPDEEEALSRASRQAAAAFIATATPKAFAAKLAALERG